MARLWPAGHLPLHQWAKSCAWALGGAKVVSFLCPGEGAGLAGILRVFGGGLDAMWPHWECFSCLLRLGGRGGAGEPAATVLGQGRAEAPGPGAALLPSLWLLQAARPHDPGATCVSASWAQPLPLPRSPTLLCPTKAKEKSCQQTPGWRPAWQWCRHRASQHSRRGRQQAVALAPVSLSVKVPALAGTCTCFSLGRACGHALCGELAGSSHDRCAPGVVWKSDVYLALRGKC